MENNRRLLEEERLLKQESVLRQIQNQVIKEKADKPEHLKMLKKRLKTHSKQIQHVDLV